jgi:hypothetical protein
VKFKPDFAGKLNFYVSAKLPDEFKSSLPSIEEIEAELSGREE